MLICIAKNVFLCYNVSMNYSIVDNGITYTHNAYEQPAEKGFFRHAHSLYEIIYFINVDADYVIENRKYAVKKGDIILIKPRDYHYLSLRSTSPYERINIGFEKWFLPPCPVLDKLFKKVELLRVSDTSFFDEWYKRMDKYIQTFSEDEALSLASILTTELIYLLSSINPLESVDAENRISPLVSKALSIIGDLPSPEITVESLSEQLFVSKSFFQHVFKKEMGISPKRFVQNKRLLSAQRQLRKGEKPTQVSENVGYHDYSTFYRAYLKLFGESPEQTSILYKNNTKR